MSTLFAYTAPGAGYPEYINVAKREESGIIIFTVRGPVAIDDAGHACHGPVAMIGLTAQQAIDLAEAVDPRHAQLSALRDFENEIDKIFDPIAHGYNPINRSELVERARKLQRLADALQAVL